MRRLSDRERLRESERLRSKEEAAYEKRVTLLRITLNELNDLFGKDTDLARNALVRDDRLAREMEYNGLKEQP